MIQPYYQDDACTIYHGDCREILPQLEPVDLVLTDPPYGVDWQSNRRQEKHERIANDSDLSWLCDAFAKIYSCLKPDSLAISFYGWPDAEYFLMAWKQSGFVPKSHIVWVKDNIGLGWFTRGQHEQAYLLTKGSPSKPETAISDVLRAQGTGNDLHPTQKPESLIGQMLAPFTRPGDTVLDPFMGSGTTLRAAKDLGRKAIGIEIEEKYCEIAVKRLAQEVLPL